MRHPLCGMLLRRLEEVTETQKDLIHGLKIFGAKTGTIVEIMLRLETESQQEEMLGYMVDHRDATPESLLEMARASRPA